MKGNKKFRGRLIDYFPLLRQGLEAKKKKVVDINRHTDNKVTL
jgi:hypothetical protein